MIDKGTTEDRPGIDVLARSCNSGSAFQAAWCRRTTTAIDKGKQIVTESIASALNPPRNRIEAEHIARSPANAIRASRTRKKKGTSLQRRPLEESMRTQPTQFPVNEPSDKCEWIEMSTAGNSSQACLIKELSPSEFLNHEKLPLDKLLQICLQSGQDMLWTEFVRRSHPIIAGVIVKTVRRRMKPSPSLVDDLVQETYLKLCLSDFKALRRFVFCHENSLFGFLKVVASNAVRDHFRAAYSRKRGSGVADLQLDHVPLTTVINHSAPVGEQRILLEAIDNCLSTSAGDPNSARDRMIFWLYFREGLAAKAISELPLISLSVKGVESTIRRLVRLIKLKLDSGYKWRAIKSEIVSGIIAAGGEN
jgi:RNA polymerase sigma-70 factor (ECF subfamily)